MCVLWYGIYARYGHPGGTERMYNESVGRSLPCEYFVFMRRFAAPESFGMSFNGDNRDPSTSLEVSSRVSGSFTLGGDGRGTLFNVCSDPSHWAGITKTAIPGASLINGDTLVTANPVIIFTTAGSWPILPMTPDINSRLDLEVMGGYSDITLSGTLSGDPFPSAEVFIADTYGNSVMLTSYMTPINKTTGPLVGVPGDWGLQLGSVNKTIPKGEGGLCSR